MKRERARAESQMRSESEEWLAIAKELRSLIGSATLPTEARVHWLQHVQPKLVTIEMAATRRVAANVASPLGHNGMGTTSP